MSLFSNFTVGSANVENNLPFRLPYVNITQNDLTMKAQTFAGRVKVWTLDDKVVKTITTDMWQIIKCNAGTSLISWNSFPSLPPPPTSFEGFEGLTQQSLLLCFPHYHGMMEVGTSLRQKTAKLLWIPAPRGPGLRLGSAWCHNCSWLIVQTNTTSAPQH